MTETKDKPTLPESSTTRTLGLGAAGLVVGALTGLANGGVSGAVIGAIGLGGAAAAGGMVASDGFGPLLEKVKAMFDRSKDETNEEGMRLIPQPSQQPEQDKAEGVEEPQKPNRVFEVSPEELADTHAGRVLMAREATEQEPAQTTPPQEADADIGEGKHVARVIKATHPGSPMVQ